MKKRNGESGQAAILTLLSMTLLLGFVGFAADVGVLLHLKRNLQTAADAAAIAGAAELGYADLTPQAAGQAAAAQNGVTNGVNEAVVAINTPPLGGVHAGNPAYVEAIVSQPQQTIFAATFAALFQGTSLSKMTVTARAVATNTGKGCVYGLGAAGTGIAVTTNGPQPSIYAPLCGIFDDSTSGTALDVNSVGDPTPITAKAIGIVGGYSETGGTVSPAPVTGMVSENDPLAYLPLPTPPAGGCLSGAFTMTAGTTTIPAGDYCTGISVTGTGGTLEFSPGTYYIDGGFSISGTGYTLSGTGVTFYIDTGALNLTALGATTLNLAAPTSGTYAGILFDQNPSDISGASITVSSSASVLEGALYFPDAPPAPLPSLTFTASGSSTNLYLDFVANSLNVTTNTTTINNYAALPGSADPIEATILVE